MDVPMFVLFGIDIIRFLVDLGTAYALYLAVSQPFVPAIVACAHA